MMTKYSWDEEYTRAVGIGDYPSLNCLPETQHHDTTADTPVWRPSLLAIIYGVVVLIPTVFVVWTVWRIL